MGMEPNGGQRQPARHERGQEIEYSFVRLALPFFMCRSFLVTRVIFPIYKHFILPKIGEAIELMIWPSFKVSPYFTAKFIIGNLITISIKCECYWTYSSFWFWKISFPWFPFFI